MNFIVRTIGGKYQELYIDSGDNIVCSGLLDGKEATELAQKMLVSVSSLLYTAGVDKASDICRELEKKLGNIIEYGVWE